MNLLEMHGPQFLLLYGLAVIMTCIVVWWSIREREAHTTSSPLRVRDPYEIGYLRGGTQELVKVVVLALMRRGLLAPEKESVQATDGASGVATASIERAILAECRSAVPADALAKFGNIEAEARSYHDALADKYLVPDEAMMTARMISAALALALLGGFALLKIVHALSTGHSNIGLLICLVIIAAIALFKIASQPRTADGDDALKHLDTLFRRLKGTRPVEVDQLDQALLLAAVYGDYAQSGTELITWRKLFPVTRGNASSAAGGSNSSCGGGGGCGGGGCGGCGS
jgi:uncharacterized protein (TIGR04222 family)